MKFYAVKKGRVPGIYRTWDATKKQVDGFSGARFKSFNEEADAIEFIGGDPKTIYRQGKNHKAKPKPKRKPVKHVTNVKKPAAPSITAKHVLPKSEDTLQNAIAKIQRFSEQTKMQSPKSEPQVKQAIKKAPEKKTQVQRDQTYFATIYTDGGTRNTGNYKGGHVKPTDKAAWAYLIEWQEAGEPKSTYGTNGEFGATNNKMELTALIEALKKLLELNFNTKPLLFVLDSQYVLNPITKGWLKSWKKRGWKKSSKGEIANLAGWQELDRLLAQFSNPEFEWTKGHANNRGNEFVDHTLNKFMDQM
ncbi:ribonuclease H family protein [Lactobacillus sp. ESL0731]|uniref:ribonuclease H family protein n=1 Tax=unclassified Lactobacillus TaxID=2620435 RepID=UPI0023FA24C2|nr:MULTISPECIES: ribonuclease H family protein [unclassified Lactobacillus]WEV51250.1 ribonuclease H family protein [Lactobacillus sp. ESL0700]WEV62380.1 ribonuclease H family protein [Lactobacillus sp. ESL0731]